MGLFSFIKNAATQAADEANGERLKKETEGFLSMMATLDPKIRGEALYNFCQIRKNILADIENTTAVGRARIGREMQKKAKENFNYDISSSCARWMAGAWVEARESAAHNAKFAYMQLEAMAHGTESIIENQVRKEWEYTNFDDWYLAFKQGAASSNKKLEPNQDGRNLIDFMDHSGFKRAYRDRVEPYQLGIEFGEQFDLSKMLPR